MAQTEFNDRSGNPIYTGDIVQYRMSFSKSGGPWNLRVIQTKRRIELVDPRGGLKGIPLQKQVEKYVSIIDKTGREK